MSTTKTANGTTRYSDWLGAKLADPKRAARYLNAALQDSPEMFLKGLRKVAELHQISKVAEEAGISRENFYRMTAEGGNPTYSSLGGVLRALGLTFVVEPLAARDTARRAAAGGG